jgi:imidazole glycerol-phosphate synthase subunit HisH
LKKKIIIVDYGAGNILSLFRAIDYLGYKSTISSKADEIFNADMIFLPGVGSFSNAINSLKKLKIYNAIKKHLSDEKKIFGICLGMHILAEVGYENKKTYGFGAIRGKVEKLFSSTNYRVPHIGFNKIKYNKKLKLINTDAYDYHYYFNHSYAIKNSKNGNFSFTNHSKKFISIFEFKNIVATQFHPEKSQENGLEIIKNFIKL